MMSNFAPHMLNLSFPLIVGFLLGCGFFYLLWLTVDKGLQSANPAIWFLGGILARMSIAITVFYWIADNDLWRLLASLIGFVIGRIIMMKFIAKTNKSQFEKREVTHAP